MQNEKLKMQNYREQITDLRFRGQESGVRGQRVDLRLEDLKIKRFNKILENRNWKIENNLIVSKILANSQFRNFVISNFLISTCLPTNLSTFNPINHLTNYHLTKIKEVKNENSCLFKTGS
jgi:hypothetical protein